jgi:23S rRNA (uracil1939-C5)-methyltransferase
MGRIKKPPLPILENLEVMKAGAEGKSLAYYNEKVVFIPYTAPGDIVDVQVTRKRSSYLEGKAIHFHHLSESRTTPTCIHFGLCGGCKWQHISYEEQSRFKEQQVKDHFQRIGKVTVDEYLPIIASDQPFFYRNKLEFTFTDRRWLTQLDTPAEEGGPVNTQGLGFHLPGMFNKVLDIDKCYLQRDPSNAIRLAVKEFAIEHDLSFYNLHTGEGLLRNLIIRTSTTGDVMVIVVFKYDDLNKRELLEYLTVRFPEITSMMYVINEKVNDIITDLEVQLYKGDSFIMEKMEAPVAGQPDLQFKVGPISFYQTNPVQARKLYQAAFNFAGFTGNELVYDLYTGTGTIAAFIARSVKHVIGIEYVEQAILDARINANINGIENTTYFAGDMARVLDRDFVRKHGKPDVVITDPPRAGMHERVLYQLLEMEPTKIIYISCNPASQSRDIAILNAKYKAVKAQPVDMFPQTHHVENVVLLERK